MSGTRTSAADLIYLNSLTATAWLTVSNEQVRQKGVPFWCHRSKQASLLVPDLQLPLAPPACSKIENILTKFAAWEHQKYLWSRHLSDFSTGNTMRKIVRFSALIVFLSWSTLHVYMLNTHVLLKTDPISWKCATLKCKPSWAKHVSLRTSFSLILSPSSLLIALVQILLSVLIACWMVVGKRQPKLRKRRKLALAKSLEHRSWHTQYPLKRGRTFKRERTTGKARNRECTSYLLWNLTCRQPCQITHLLFTQRYAHGPAWCYTALHWWQICRRIFSLTCSNDSGPDFVHSRCRWRIHKDAKLVVQVLHMERNTRKSARFCYVGPNKAISDNERCRDVESVHCIVAVIMHNM